MDHRNDENIVPNIPLLNTSTRQTMSNAVFLLVKDDPQQFQNLINFLLGLLPYDFNEGNSIYSSIFLPASCLHNF